MKTLFKLEHSRNKRQFYEDKSLRIEDVQHMDERTKNLILVNQLGKLSNENNDFIVKSVKAVTGNDISSVASLISKSSKFGTKWSASKLKTIEYQESFIDEKTLAKSIEYSLLLLSDMGEILNPPDNFSEPILTAVVGSGSMDLNPTIVFMQFIAIDEEQTEIHITASAKEGLIKQKSSEKAVRKIITSFKL